MRSSSTGSVLGVGAVAGAAIKARTIVDVKEGVGIGDRNGLDALKKDAREAGLHTHSPCQCTVSRLVAAVRI
jgi:hypothetical protein